jgi:hypothetical protein
VLKGCGALVLAWAVLAIAEWQAQIRLSGQESWPWAIGLALLLVLALAGIWSIPRALSLAAVVRRAPHEWRDGALGCARGRLGAAGRAVTAPLSGTAAVLYEYTVDSTARRRGGASERTLARGLGMTPCVIHTTAGPVGLRGFPVLTEFKEARVPEDAVGRLADHLIAAPVRVGRGGGAHFGLRELVATLEDQDGDVQVDLADARLVRLIEAERRGREQAAGAPPGGEAGGPAPAPPVAPTGGAVPDAPGGGEAEDDAEEAAEDEEDAEAEAATAPPGSVAAWLDDHAGLQLRETVIANHTEVTAIGTWHAASRRLDVGNPLRKARHQVTSVPPGRLVRKELRQALVFAPLWLAAAGVAHAYAYPAAAVRLTAGTPLAPLAARVAGWNPHAAPAVLRTEEQTVVAASSHDVVGSLQETNVGRVALVDGLAWTVPEGTVVRLVGKPVAGRHLAGSPCPEAQLAALELLRDTQFAQITLDAAGRSAYLAFGRSTGPSVTEHDVGSGPWKIRIETRTADRIAGRLSHGTRGGVRFDVAIAPGARPAGAPAEPLGAETLQAAYDAVRTAVARQDAGALLGAFGFDPAQSAAVLALPGLGEDLEAFALKFLDTATPDEIALRPEGTSFLLFRGANSQGRPFANFYHFVACRATPVLVKIAVNPQ